MDFVPLADRWFEELPYETQIELLAKSRAGDDKARNRLVKCVSRFTVQCAVKFRCSRRLFPLDDRIQVAMLGVMRAINLWDPDKGRLTTYAAYAIWSELLTFAKRDGFIRAPDGWSAEKRAALHVVFPMGHAKRQGKHNNVAQDARNDWARSDAPPPGTEVEEDDTRRLLELAMHRLPYRDREVVERTINGEGFEEIGKSMGFTRSRAHQLYVRGIKRLREDDRIQKLAA